MKSSVNESGAVTVVHLEGNLMGGPDATALNSKLHELVEAGRKQVVVDLKGVEFINSSGLGLLIGGASLLKNAGGGLKLACASEKITALIKITRLGPVFESFTSVDDAVKSFTR
jgi:anti-sigma B factor antagonist